MILSFIHSLLMLITIFSRLVSRNGVGKVPVAAEVIAAVSGSLTTVAAIPLRDDAGEGGYVNFIYITFTTMIPSFIHSLLMLITLFSRIVSCNGVGRVLVAAEIIAAVSGKVLSVNLGKVRHYIFDQCPSS